jgi:hypothetical protein
MSLDIWLEQFVDFGGPDGPEKRVLLDKNITHNLNGMWRLIGVYDALYMSDGQLSGDHVGALEVGVDFMLDRPDECKKHDAPNGWGTYKDAVPWLRDVLDAFRRYPKATIRVSK